MGIDQQPDQKSKKSSFFDRYKQNTIEKETRKLDQYKESSGSWIWYDRIFTLLLDLLMWGIIAYFAYLWWQARGSPITCDRVDVSFCNACFGQARQITQNISGIIGGLM